MSMTIQTIQSRTRSGKTITVALIPVSRMTTERPEARNDEASALAVAVGCGPRAWRLVDDRGTVIQLPSRTLAEAERLSR